MKNKKDTNTYQQKKNSNWKKVKLGDICDVRDGTHESPKYLPKGIPFITSKHLKNNRIDFSNVKFISIEDHKSFSKRSKVDDGDILFGMIGTIGNPVVVDKDREFSIKNVALFKQNNKIINFFLKALLQSRFTKTNLIAKSVGGSQKFVSLSSLRNFKIPLPPLSEQKRIVEILSTWDQAIETINKLTSAKKKQFRWLLKKLITDQKNNPNWKKVKLGEILDYKQPTNYIVYSTNYNNEYITPVLTAGKTFIIGYTNEKDGVFSKNKLPVIIFDDFTTDKRFIDFPFKVKSSAIKILLSRKEIVDIKFVFYSMQNINFQTKTHKRHWISEYSKLKIPLPPISEQKRISEKLSTAKKEIKTLKHMSNKYKEQKKGLMQKLLTGEIKV